MSRGSGEGGKGRGCKCMLIEGHLDVLNTSELDDCGDSAKVSHQPKHLQFKSSENWIGH